MTSCPDPGRRSFSSSKASQFVTELAEVHFRTLGQDELGQGFHAGAAATVPDGTCVAVMEVTMQDIGGEGVLTVPDMIGKVNDGIFTVEDAQIMPDVLIRRCFRLPVEVTPQADKLATLRSGADAAQIVGTGSGFPELAKGVVNIAKTAVQVQFFLCR
jgi:hypothetical protein